MQHARTNLVHRFKFVGLGIAVVVCLATAPLASAQNKGAGHHPGPKSGGMSGKGIPSPKPAPGKGGFALTTPGYNNFPPATGGYPGATSQYQQPYVQTTSQYSQSYKQTGNSNGGSFGTNRPVPNVPHPNGPPNNANYINRGVNYKHWCFNSHWNGWSHRCWCVQWGCPVYWCETEGCWYVYDTDDDVFLPCDNLTYQNVNCFVPYP